MNLAAVSHFLGAIFEWTWRTSLHASVLIVLVCLIQLAGGKWLAPRWRYALGVLVLVRLLLPAVPASAFSIFNLSKRVLPAAPQTEMSVVPPSSMPTTLIPAVSYESVASLRVKVRAEQKTDWLKAVQVLWLLGLTVSLLTVLRQHRKFARRIAAVPPVGDERILSLLESCRNVMGVRRRLTAFIAPQLGTPAVFGYRKPRLLIPETALRKLDDCELRMIFLHELAHVKRGDVLLNWVIIFVRSLHWFNPLVWLALRRLRADRELVCDALVMSHLAADERRTYGNTLIKLLDEFSAAGFCPSLAPVINHKTEVKRRVTMIAHFKPASRIALFLSAATLIAVCCFTFTRAAEKKVAPREAAASTPQAASSREAGRRSETESSGVQSVQRMRQKLDELKARVRQAEEIVDELRRRYIIPSWVAEGKSESSFDSETIRRLEASRIEVESNYRGLAASLTQLRELKSQGSDTVRKAMLTVNYDPQLGKLLENLWATEATLAKLKETVASDHPEFKSVAAMRADLDQRVSERIEGILSGIEAKAAATKAQMESIAREVDEAKKRDAESTANYRPYFQAKRDLESLQKIRDALYLKVLEQEYGVEVPKVKSEER